MGIVLVNQGGEGRSVIDHVSKATTASTARKVAAAPTPNPATTSQAAANAPKATPDTRAQNCVPMEHTEKIVPINATVETTLCATRYPESASANRGILGRTVRVDVCREDSDRTAISCALVKTEESAILPVDRVSAHPGTLGQSVRLRASRIGLDQPAKKSATARTAARATVSQVNVAVFLDSLASTVTKCAPTGNSEPGAKRSVDVSMGTVTPRMETASVTLDSPDLLVSNPVHPGSMA